MKTALVTLCIPLGPNVEWMKAGLPSKQEYARRIGADFINITDAKLGGSVASEKYQVREMLGTYDRILYIDADTFVVPDAPNLFNVVPEDHFGAYDEGRPALYAWLKEGWPDDPCEFYVNNGLFVCSREHAWLFDHATLNRKLNTYEQTHMSRRIWEALEAKPPRIKMHWLPQNWNCMPRLWVGNEWAPERGWVHNVVPDPVWMHHFPCHRPHERLEEIKRLNKEFGL